MGWLSGWAYRREITITEQSGSTLTDYQVRIELDSSNFDFSKANADGSDIRFTEDDGTTLLSYWIEKWDDVNEEATIWVKVPSIPANGETTIYLYYGNSGAESESDGEAVFEFFDDFSGTELDTSKWTIDDEASATREIISSSEATHGNLLHIVASSSGRAFQYSKTSFEDDKYIFEARTKYPNEKVRLIFDTQDKNNHYLYHHVTDSGIWVLYKRVGGSYSGIVKTSIAYDNGWEISRIYRDGSGVIHLIANGVELATSSDATYSSGYVGVSVADGCEAYVDWVRVRKYAEQEPLISVGSEGLPISGIVKLPDGTAVEGATVISIREDTYEIVDTTTSGSDGSYTLAAVGGVNNTVIVIPSSSDQNGDIKCHIQPA